MSASDTRTGDGLADTTNTCAARTPVTREVTAAHLLLLHANP